MTPRLTGWGRLWVVLSVAWSLFYWIMVMLYASDTLETVAWPVVAGTLVLWLAPIVISGPLVVAIKWVVRGFRHNG